MERREVSECEKHTTTKERSKPWILWRWVDGATTWA